MPASIKIFIIERSEGQPIEIKAERGEQEET